MRIRAIFLLLAGLAGALPATAQPYRAPEGNCDAAVMQLEAARVANDKQVQALDQALHQDKRQVCTQATLKAADTRLAAANRLSQRAVYLLSACPGMDDAMEQGGKMTTQGKIEIAAGTKSRLDLIAACPALQ